MEVLLAMVGIVVGISLLASAVTGLLALIMFVIVLWPFLVCLFIAANALLGGNFVAAAMWTMAGLVLQFLWLHLRERASLPKREERPERGSEFCKMPVGQDAAIDWYIRRMSNVNSASEVEPKVLMQPDNSEGRA